MVWVRKKARLRSWRIGLGLGLVGGGKGGRRNYNFIHYYLDRFKKTPPPKKIHRTDIVMRKEKNESKLCVCSKKANDNHKGGPAILQFFFFRTEKEKKTTLRNSVAGIPFARR